MSGAVCIGDYIEQGRCSDVMKGCDLYSLPWSPPLGYRAGGIMHAWMARNGEDWRFVGEKQAVGSDLPPAQQGARCNSVYSVWLSRNTACQAE